MVIWMFLGFFAVKFWLNNREISNFLPIFAVFDFSQIGHVYEPIMACLLFLELLIDLIVFKERFLFFCVHCVKSVHLFLKFSDWIAFLTSFFHLSQEDFCSFVWIVLRSVMFYLTLKMIFPLCLSFAYFNGRCWAVYESITVITICDKPFYFHWILKMCVHIVSRQLRLIILMNYVVKVAKSETLYCAKISACCSQIWECACCAKQINF